LGGAGKPDVQALAVYRLLDTAGMSVPYVASWGESHDLDAVKTYAGVVDEMARQLEEVCEA
jgi:hypothetical protein